MPGFSIHLILAKEYDRKHKGEIKDFKEFCKGSIKPDLNDTLDDICQNKLESHYGILRDTNDGRMIVNNSKLFRDNLDKIDTDYFKGYLLHILADDYFYNDYFDKVLFEVLKNNETLHSDFDAIENDLRKKYNFSLPKELVKYTKVNNNPPKYIDFPRVCDYIDKMSDINLNLIIDEEKIKLAHNKITK